MPGVGAETRSGGGAVGGNSERAGGQVGGGKLWGVAIGGVAVEGRYRGRRPIPGARMWPK